MVGARRRARAEHRHALAALGRGDAAAGRAANARGIPVVLDPVGAGATRYRTETAKRILDEVDVTVLRGNAGEVATLVGVEAEVRGVESIGAGGDAAELAREAARRSASSRPSPGRSTTSPTASACSRSRTAIRCSRRSPARAACRAPSPAASSRSPSSPLEAAAEALVAFGVAGEDAARGREGPGLVPRRPLRRARGARSGDARRQGARRVRVHAIVDGSRDGAARGRGRRDGRAAAREGADGRGRRARPRLPRARRDVRRQRRRRRGARARRRRRASRPGRSRRRGCARGAGCCSAARRRPSSEALAADADYLGVGPVWETPSKDDADPALGLDGLRAICAAVARPRGRDRRHRRLERRRLHSSRRGRASPSSARRPTRRSGGRSMRLSRAR